MRIMPLLAIGLAMIPVEARTEPADSPAAPRRFFSDDSFWNQVIPAGAEVDPRTDRWVKLLET